MYAGILGARLSDVGVVLVYNNSASAPFGQESGMEIGPGADVNDLQLHQDSCLGYQ